MNKTFILSYFLFFISYLLLSGCASSPPQKQQAIPLPDRHKLPPAHSLAITSPVTADTIEWGAPYGVPLEVLWVSGQRMPVRLAPAAGTPSWLMVEIHPATLDTAAQVTVRLTPVPGLAPLGSFKFVLEASSDSLPRPVQKEFKFYVRRQTGVFTRLKFGTESLTCDSVCADVSPGGVLVFYDMRQGATPCTDSSSTLRAQPIGVQAFALAEKGFALGSGCRVALVYEQSGMLSFVNLGLSPRVPLGAVLLSLNGAQQCWLSPDNTLVLVAMPGAAIPYEIATGRMLGGPCRLQSDSVTVRIHNNSTLRAGQCKWELQ